MAAGSHRASPYSRPHPAMALADVRTSATLRIRGISFRAVAQTRLNVCQRLFCGLLQAATTERLVEPPHGHVPGDWPTVMPPALGAGRAGTCLGTRHVVEELLPDDLPVL